MLFTVSQIPNSIWAFKHTKQYFKYTLHLVVKMISYLKGVDNMYLIESCDYANRKMLRTVDDLSYEFLLLESEGNEVKKEGILKRMWKAIVDAINKIKEFFSSKDSAANTIIPVDAKDQKVETKIDVEKASKAVEEELKVNRDNLKNISSILSLKPVGQGIAVTSPSSFKNKTVVSKEDRNAAKEAKRQERATAKEAKLRVKEEARRRIAEENEIKRQERLIKLNKTVAKAIGITGLTVIGAKVLLGKFKKYTDTLDKNTSALKRIIDAGSNINPDAAKEAQGEMKVMSRITAVINQCNAELHRVIKEGIKKGIKDVSNDTKAAVVSKTADTVDKAKEKLNSPGTQEAIHSAINSATSKVIQSVDDASSKASDFSKKAKEVLNSPDTQEAIHSAINSTKSKVIQSVDDISKKAQEALNSPDTQDAINSTKSKVMQSVDDISKKAQDALNSDEVKNVKRSLKKTAHDLEYRAGNAAYNSLTNMLNKLSSLL
jgi:hypothetical protein